MEIYKIDHNFSTLVVNMKPTMGQSVTVQSGTSQQGPPQPLGHPNQITFLASAVSDPNTKYAFKLEQKNNFIKVSKFTVSYISGFVKFTKDSLTNESYYPILDNMGTQPDSTLHSKLNAIITNTPSATNYYFKIIDNQIGIDTDQQNPQTITNLLSVPFSMANIDRMLAENPDILSGGSKQSKKTLTKEKVLYNGRKHSIYLGSRGGKYIKTKGTFVSLTRLNL